MIDFDEEIDDDRWWVAYTKASPKPDAYYRFCNTDTVLAWMAALPGWQGCLATQRHPGSFRHLYVFSKGRSVQNISFLQLNREHWQ